MKTEYGFCVGDGWFGLLDCIGSYISGAVVFENSCVKHYKEDLKTDAYKHWTWTPSSREFEYPVVEQVKEKMGGLRFYISGGELHTEQFRYCMREAIHMAESLSFTICENCGNKGQVRNSHVWIRTLCDDCESKRKK